MPFTLEDSWTKHARGTEHLGALAFECDEYLGSVVFSADTVPHPETGAVEIRFVAEPSPPPRLGAIVWDIAHNLRSALDVAAWQLAIANDAVAARKRPNAVQFPLTSTPERFQDHSALRFFSESARAVMQSLQPYQVDMEALGWLRALSNSDKHRIATYSFTGLTANPSAEVGVRGFSNPQILFGADEGQIGLVGLQAIAVTVEGALRDLERLREGTEFNTD